MICIMARGGRLVERESPRATKNGAGTMAAETFLTIPDNRGNIALEIITGVVVYAPRAPFTDEITGRQCAAVLLVETKRCLHRFGFATAADAQALVAAHGFAARLTETPSNVLAFDGEDETPLPRLPSAKPERTVKAEHLS